MNPYWIIGVGLLAQLLFSARLLVQWIVSEKAHKVLSPVLFWQLSILASFMLCVYGWLRDDAAIILGQSVAYYIYIWNLNAKKSWKTIPKVLRILFLYTPVAAFLYFLSAWQDTLIQFFRQESIPPWLIIFGIAGQFTFTLRFVYQWLYSRRRGKSLLPLNFWLISITGSVMIIAYAVIRKDPVLIIGQATGLVVYTRNVMIDIQSRRSQHPKHGNR